MLIGENMHKMIRLGNIYGEQYGTGFAGNVWDKMGIIPSLMTAQGGGRTPMIIIESRKQMLRKESDVVNYRGV